MISYEAWIGYWVYIWLNSGSRLHSTGVSGAKLSLGLEAAHSRLLHLSSLARLTFLWGARLSNNINWDMPSPSQLSLFPHLHKTVVHRP
jgi:hypothetical protein